MKNSTRSTIKSVVALSVISVVCVAVLMLGNAFIPKYKPSLDVNTAVLINGICPTGVDDATVGANKDEYFEMLALDDKALDKFNKDNGVNINNKVLAVYKALKGDNAGAYIVEAQALAYNDAVILLTAFDASGALLNMTVKSHSDDLLAGSIFNDAQLNALKEYIAGKDSFELNSVLAATGATTKASTRGVVDTLNISVKVTGRLITNGGKL